jgi:hypothetical protein
MKRHFARKVVCSHGHKHDSGAEATRCAELHLLFRAGKIEALVYGRTFKLTDGTRPIIMANGQQARYTPDFVYLENGVVVAEDVKAKNGFVERDFPLRAALFKSNNPDIELRIVKR